MARTVRDHRLENRTQRAKLDVRAEPYWRTISEGFHVGYYRGKRVAKWVARARPAGRAGGYNKVTLGEADDVLDPDGDRILSWGQAQAKAVVWRSGQLGAGRRDLTYTVGDALDDYLKQSTARDVAGARNRADKIIKPLIGDVRMDRLAEDDVERVRDTLAGSPIRRRSGRYAAEKNTAKPEGAEGLRKRRATANRNLTVLKAALNHAYRKKRIASDAAWRMVEPFKGVDAPRTRYLSDEEARRLVNAMEPDFRPLVQAALLTGARYGELRAIRTRDYDSEAGVAHLTTTKADKPRDCYLDDDGRALFDGLALGKLGDALLFTRPDGAAWADSQQQRRMKAASEAGSIQPRATFHDLRRSYGARLARKGVPMAVIAEALGHADERITRRHYAHLHPSYVADTVRQSIAGLGIVERDHKVVAIGGQHSPP